MTMFEMYNGLGYAAMGRPSAYVWSGSDQYVSGKYVRDHVYDPNEVDVQVGCAPLLARMMALDPSITFGLPGAPARRAAGPPHPSPSPRTASGTISSNSSPERYFDHDSLDADDCFAFVAGFALRSTHGLGSRSMAWRLTKARSLPCARRLRRSKKIRSKI
jgi:hypothetical protein